MSSEQYLIDAATRHQVFVQRYAGGLSNQYQKALKKTYAEVLARLMEDELTDIGAARLTQIRLDMEQILSNGYNAAKTELLLNLNEFATSEAAFTGQLLANGSATQFSVALPATQQIQTALSLNTFSPDNGKTLVNIETALDNFGTKKAANIRQIVKDGFLLGDTNADIASMISDAEKINRAQADSLARTMTNHASNVARAETFNANDDVVTGYEWVATLDSRTTLTCSGRDGEIYSLSAENPKPPAHFNCRSTTVPVIDPEFDIGASGKGTRQSKGAKGKERVSAKTTFGGWLKKQPADFQDEYFSKFQDGSIKAKLFRKGGLKIDKFTDVRGAEYSLSELKALNPLAFDVAKVQWYITKRLQGSQT